MKYKLIETGEYVIAKDRKYLKGFILGFIVGIIFMSYTSSSLQAEAQESYGTRGSVEWNPLYVKIVK